MSADFELPEFMRSLRALGSAKWLGDADHERIFAPLMTARRNAARVRTAEGHVAAFQADRLRRAFTDGVLQLAAARHPTSPPEQRALAARITDAGVPVWDALEAMERAAAELPRLAPSARGEVWQSWVREVQQLFLAADTWWQRIVVLRDGKETGASYRALGLLLALGALLAPLSGHAQQHLTYRVSGMRADSIARRGFDVVGVEQGNALVVADPTELARLQGLGVQATLRTAQGTDNRRLMNLAAVATTTRIYRSYDDPTRGIRFFVDSLVKNNPRVSVDTVGFSYQNRPILAVKVGPKGDAADRPNVLFVATHHAREWAATEMALRLLRRLATATDARTDSLINRRDVWIVPVVNPDGYEYTFTTDRLWRKNRHPFADGTGVDINRNHSTNWGIDDIGSSPNAQSEIYRGPSPASEPETQALQQWHAKHPPVISITYHTYGGLFLFPPGARAGVLGADLDSYRTLAGTNVAPTAFDRLPGSLRSFYSPTTAWTLYPTNGEYTDWASQNYGTISINPELTSGYGPGGYYGFEFPDDETLLTRLFDDNAPFALDAIEMAADPVHYRNPETGATTARWVLESGAPRVRIRGLASAVGTATIKGDNLAIPVTTDSTSGARYSRRLIAQSTNTGRPAALSLTTATEQVSWSLLAAAGAEAGDPAWTLTTVVLDSVTKFAGRASYRNLGGELRSTAIAVPSNIDTVSVTYWTRYDGDGYSEVPFGLVRYSADNGQTWTTVGRVQGSATEWYPEDLRIGGVKGKSIMLSFLAVNLPWRIDEVVVYGHGTSAVNGGGGPPTGASFAPSANPVRGNRVTFTWPFTGKSGRVLAYDFTGRLVWQSDVAAGAVDIAWDLTQGHVPNGAYLVIAESGGTRQRLRLFIVRTTE